MKTVILIIVFITQNACTFSESVQMKMDRLLTNYTNSNQFNGVVLYADGEETFSKAYGYSNLLNKSKLNVDEKFRIGSITKQFTSMMIMRQVEEGIIKLDGKISDYIKEYPKEFGSVITIHNLLTHSSGIPNYTGISDFFGRFGRNENDPSDIMKFVWNRELDFKPGSESYYSNSGYLILGLILERVSSKSYEQLLNEEILKPLKMSNTGHNKDISAIESHATAHNLQGSKISEMPFYSISIAFAAGSMYSTVDDLFKWEQALSNYTLLSKEYSDIMEKAYFDKYAYGWFNEDLLLSNGKKINLIYHTGSIPGYSSVIARIPSQKKSFILLSNAYDAQLESLYSKLYHISQDIVIDYDIRRLKDLIVDVDIKDLHEVVTSNYEKLNTSEGELNDLAYRSLSENKLNEALILFQANCELNPESPNTFDGLGDAYIATENKEKAIEAYQKALAIDPRFKASIDNLNALGFKLKMPEKVVVSVDKKILKSYVGLYAFDAFDLKITFEKEELFGLIPGQAKAQFYAESDQTFFIKTGNNIRFEFKGNEIIMRIGGMSSKGIKKS